MPVIPFIPLIARGAAAGISAYAAHRAQKKAGQRGPEEQQALGGAQQAAAQTGQSGQQFLQQAQPMIEQPANYYSQLLRGNRAAQAQAVAPGMANLTDVYRGAERDLSRRGVTGAARDQASSELNRLRASQLAGLVTGVQPFAAQQLGSLGLETGNLGGGLAQTSGNIYSNLLGHGFQNRAYARQQGREAGQAWGGFLRDIVQDVPGYPGKPGGGPTTGPYGVDPRTGVQSGEPIPPGAYPQPPFNPAPNPNPQTTYTAPGPTRTSPRYTGSPSPY